MKKLHIYLPLLLIVPFTQKITAQCTTNFLKNAGFELPVQTNAGNNYPVTLADWTITGGPANLVRATGVANYYGGPNAASEGVQYLDIASASGYITQSFTTTCAAVLTFSGDFSSRETGTTWSAVLKYWMHPIQLLRFHLHTILQLLMQIKIFPVLMPYGIA